MCAAVSLLFVLPATALAAEGGGEHGGGGLISLDKSLIVQVVNFVGANSRFKQLEDLRGCRFAYNSRHSNSGMNLPRRAIAEIAGGKPFFGAIAETHSHPGNIERVARGEIDATCVDNVTYAFVARHRPAWPAQRAC